MDIFSLYNSIPGLINMAGQGANAATNAFRGAFTPEEDDDQPSKIQQNALRQQSQRGRPQVYGDMRNISQEFARMMGPGSQARTLQDMANQTTGALSQEMQGRRSSFREARRLAHERDMLLLRLQAEREMRGR